MPLRPPETISSALEKRYADFLRNEKGLAELSLRVYLPLVADLLGYLEKQHGSMSVRRLDAGMLRAFLFDRTQGRSSAVCPVAGHKPPLLSALSPRAGRDPPRS